MSDDTEVVAPEADPAVLDTSPAAPGDGTAVDTESAELRKRFNGLMAKHQSALDALVQEREQRLAAEARLQEGQNTVSETDNATLSEVQALRAELAESRLAAAKSEALRKYPDAAPMADLIAGNTVQEIEQVTRAFAERIATLKPPPELQNDGTPAGEQTPPAPAVAPVVVPGSVTAPMVSGGDAPPGVPVTPADALAEAKRIAWNVKPDSQEAWNLFFESTVTPDAAAGLA